MRVALFFDGKNHMKDLRRTAQDKWIDHGALAEWTVKHVDGSRFVGAFYYTGVPTSQDEGHERHALTDLLEELERRPGFFVKRFNRRTTTRECPHCNEVITYTEEKMVDTSLVTDLVVLGMQDAFDCAVVFTGDLDVAPGLAALRALGKQAWIATFGDFGLSKSLTREAWAHIDLLPHIDAFAHPELEGAPKPEIVAPPASDVDSEVLRELRRAEAHFAAGGGFVGAHYFIHRWKGHGIPEAPDARRLALQRLMMLGRVVSYSVDGKTAIRTAEGAVALDDLKVLSSAAADEDETTVELRRRVPDMADLRSDRVGDPPAVVPEVVTRRLRVRAEE
ncbi:MAG: NYN domain-containing protein [Myxococcota bacterium]